MSKPKTRQERIDKFGEACTKLGFAHAHHIVNLVHGQLSVSQRNNSVKVPLSLPLDQILPDADLRHLGNVKTAKMVPVIVFIDMDDLPQEQ